MPDLDALDAQDDGLLARHLKAELVSALRIARVVNVVGPRQVGKTTLVRDLFGKGRFLTLDDESVQAAIERDPLGQLHSLSREAGNLPVIIDEAQRSSKLALAVKKIVDEQRRMGQFVLTGSSNIFTTLNVTDSLAGRVQTLTMLPLSTAELHGAGPAKLLDWAIGRAQEDGGPTLTGLPTPAIVPRDYYLDLVVRGGYPEVWALPPRARTQRYRSYIDTIVDRDVADLLKIRKNDAMRRLINQMAVRTGKELNVRELGNLIGIQAQTTDQYVDVLARLSLVTRLGAWSSGEGRREIRHPKMHVIDTGVVSALRSLTPESFSAGADPEALGGILESFVHSEVLKNLAYQEDDWRLYHYRHERTREIDIVAESGRNIVAFEVKAASSVSNADFKHLRWFRSEGPGARRNVTGVVIYLGERALAFSERMFALPLSIFWAFGKEAGTGPERVAPRRRRRAAGTGTSLAA